MVKCKDNGQMTCISKQGKPKSRWKTQDEVIRTAKFLNEKYPKKDSKLVGYKCSNCHHYHLTTVKKKVKKYF